MKRSQFSIIAALAAVSVAGASYAGTVSGLTAADSAGPSAKLVVGVYDTAQPVGLEKTQWIFGGRNYCWYMNGWRGPGYYWCGYALRRGYGWGGGAGWNSWGGGWRDGWTGAGWRPGWRGPQDMGVRGRVDLRRRGNIIRRREDIRRDERRPD